MLGIIHTDHWMDEHFFEPEKICEKIAGNPGITAPVFINFYRKRGCIDRMCLRKIRFLS